MNTEFSLRTVLQKVDAIREHANTRIFEREIETDTVLLTVLADTSSLLIGDPGAAKTEHIQLIAEMLGLSMFDITMSESVKPDAIFGPTDVPALAAGVQRVKTKGYAPEAEVVFFDEVFKANGVVLNPLLSLINERIFRNGDEGVIKCPIMGVFGASNEIPTEDNMRAIYDRFLIRHHVSYLKSPGNIQRMFENTLNRGTVEQPEPLTSDEVKYLRGIVRAVEFPVELREMVIKIRDTVQQAVGVRVSDRRLNKSLRIIQANALLNRRARVENSDLEVLAHLFWETPEQIRKVASIVTANTGALSGDYLSYQETAEKIYEHSLATGNLREGFGKLRDMIAVTRKFETKSGVVVHRTIYDYALKLRNMLKERKTFIVNVLPNEHGKSWYKLSEASAQLWTAAQLRSVKFKYSRKFGYWHIPAESKLSEERIRRSIIKLLKVAPQFKKLV